LHDLILGAQRRCPTLGLGPNGAIRVAPGGPRVARQRREPTGIDGGAVTLAGDEPNDG